MSVINHRHWCILRTGGPRTLPLARSLANAGFEVWTPVETRSRRLARSKRAATEIDAAVLPTFVFARADRLDDLLLAADALDSPHPAFSVFTHLGRIPLVEDAEMQALHEFEEAARLQTRRKQRRAYVLGQRVRVQEGSFAGLSGIVQSSTDRHAYVSFGGRMRVQVGTWLLQSVDVSEGQPAEGTVA